MANINIGIIGNIGGVITLHAHVVGRTNWPNKFHIPFFEEILFTSRLEFLHNFVDALHQFIKGLEDGQEFYIMH